MKKFIIENGILLAYQGNAKHVVIPNGVTKIGAWVFYENRNLTGVTIPSSVTRIANFAFYGCNNLKKITLPNSVTSIGYSAFVNCTSLASVDMPNNCEIDNYAFSYCKNLKTIKLSNSMKYIGFCAFVETPKVKPQYNQNGTLRAFKAFNEDWTCKNFQYKVGQSFHQDGSILCCMNGFHACTNPLAIFCYYFGDMTKRCFAEVELSGEISWEDDKVAASDIKIIRELTLQELFDIYNSMEKE